MPVRRVLGHLTSGVQGKRYLAAEPSSAKLPFKLSYSIKEHRKSGGANPFGRGPAALVNLIIESHQSASAAKTNGGTLAAKRKFTRIPKVQDLILAGVPTEVIPTYCALSDYTNNKTGLCWPKMETLAFTLRRSVRTIQRHLHHLQHLGLVEFVERRRWRGRYSSYTYRVLHITQLIRSRKRASSTTTGHTRPVERGAPILTGTKASKTPPYKPPKEAFNWFFGKERNLEAEEQHRREQAARRSEASRRRSEGYEWLFSIEG